MVTLAGFRCRERGDDIAEPVDLDWRWNVCRSPAAHTRGKTGCGRISTNPDDVERGGRTVNPLNVQSGVRLAQKFQELADGNVLCGEGGQSWIIIRNARGANDDAVESGNHILQG